MKVICFHQSADLYGSDRSFLQVVEYFVNSQSITRITVVLPRSGPLAEKLNMLGVEVLFMDLSLLSKTYLKSLQWGKILFPLFKLGKKKELIEKYDILYVNTSVILDFYVLAPFLKVRKIIHIREIPSAWLGKILSGFISRSNALTIFNSHSTRKSFSTFKDSIVIHNAFEGYTYSKTDSFQSQMLLSDKPLKILLIGRINTWKGQDFTIQALSKIPNKNFHLRIVGSTSAGNEILLDQLKATVKELGLDGQVDFVEFALDPEIEYKNADVVIVPSIKPEPFGRIAIEAMSVGKPVIAANHGGLPEIIEHNKNGFLFNPGNAESFNSYVQLYVNNRDLLVSHGVASREIFLDRFSIDKMHKQLNNVFRIDNITQPAIK